jgi:sigma-B regulation protein RsbU (phosphoserine phosphatase)
MPRSKTEASDIRRKGSSTRTQLNHIVGYSHMLRQDSVEARRGDLASIFGAIADSALALREPLDALLGKEGHPPLHDANLDHEIYGILYAIIALVQDAKGKAQTSGLKDLSAEAERLLEASNTILEIIAAEGEIPEVEPAIACLPRQELEGSIAPVAALQGRILVVDDNLFNREMLARNLERQGHIVRAAADGLAALELLRSESFDVAIIDVMLSGMNGYQLLERIRAEEALKGVHAIVISALEDTRIIARCIQLGAEDYLPREFEPVILKARIESCLEKKLMKEEQELFVRALVDAQEKLSSELRGGAAYVRSLLPGRLAFPELSIDWEFEPSASLGGDVFGYHLLGGENGGPGTGRLALYLIDVSGHGIEAALFSVTLMNMLKNQVLPGADFADPGSVLARLNASFKMEEQNNLYFTAWYGVWDHGTRELTYASAGSPPALLVLPDGSSEELSTGGAIVGMNSASSYDSARAIVPRGTGLYVFSDGIYEFQAKDGSIFGISRFKKALAEIACAPQGGKGVLARLIARAREEAGTARFSDDVSLLELRLD